DELDAAVADLVARVTRGSAMGRSIGKRTFYAQVGLDQRQAYDVAVEVMAAAALTDDAQEGIAAFLAKRPATFTSLPVQPQVGVDLEAVVSAVRSGRDRPSPGQVDSDDAQL
ncbi:MAG: hypothetical protein WBP39_02030, partial [Candidatus Phosphoribacter baldrii]